jgi:hypothetical protein
LTVRDGFNEKKKKKTYLDFSAGSSYISGFFIAGYMGRSLSNSLALLIVLRERFLPLLLFIFSDRASFWVLS